MKIIATSDVHQMISKWKDLVKLCQQEKPDVLAIAGDLMPKDSSITGQMQFLPHLVKYCLKIRNVGTEIAILLGNDDNQNLVSYMEQYQKAGTWHYVADKVATIRGYEFAGMPWVPDYPFGYKYWCRGESPDCLRISRQQFTDPVIITPSNKFENIPDYKAYLMGQKTILACLEDTASQIKDMSKSIWLIHCPPALMNLDVCAHGEKVGSNAVLKFVKEHQPLLTIHGHIHESPEYNGNKWYHQEGHTLCVQGGQLGKTLHYSILEIEDGIIVKKRHSIYD